MALIGMQQLPGQLAGLAHAPPGGAVLLFGEPYLCRQALHQIETALLAQGGTLHPIDGDEEDPRQTLARISSFSLLGGRQVYRVVNTRLLHSRTTGKALWERVLKARAAAQEDALRRALSAFVRAGDLPLRQDALLGMSAAQWQKHFGFAAPGEDLGWTAAYLPEAETDDGGTVGADPGDQLVEVLTRGLPPGNVLLLVAEEVDRRKKLFKFLQEHATVIDCSVAEGSGAKARGEQEGVLRALLHQTLQEQGKKLPQDLVPTLLSRVGFHPVALVNEVRKLVLAAGERETISREDMEELLGRTRQDALYELHHAILQGQLDEALVLLQRLREQGVHPLAMLASLRNSLRSTLLFRALIEGGDPPFSPTMPFNNFQQQYLPALKKQGNWSKELAGHPFALFNQFREAGRHTLPRLCSWMALLLEAEYRLKGSAADEALVLHRLLCSMLAPSSSDDTAFLANSSTGITIHPG